MQLQDQSLPVAQWIFDHGGTQIPDQGIILTPALGIVGALATRPAGKSPVFFFGHELTRFPKASVSFYIIMDFS